MSHSAASVARYIVDKQAEQGKTLTPMQLMKIVYVCHGMFLGKHGEPLVSDPVEAWAYGPVIRDLYRRIKEYGSGPVTSLNIAPAQLTGPEQEIVDSVSSYYGKYDGIRLSKMTHMSGTPWERTYNQGGQNAVIPDDLIANFYSKKAQN